MNPITYLKHVRAEMKHVVWPDPKVAAGHTLIILGIGAFTAAFIGVLDYVFTQGVSKVIGV